MATPEQNSERVVSIPAPAKDAVDKDLARPRHQGSVQPLCHVHKMPEHTTISKSANVGGKICGNIFNYLPE